MSAIHLKIRVVTLLFIVQTLLSCLKDDSECPPAETGKPEVTFTFVYDYNTDGKDKLREQVRHIGLYIFDADDNLHTFCDWLVKDLTQGNSVSLELPAGNYTVISWGNTDGDDYSLFHDSTISGMNLSLHHNSGIVDWHCEDLFHGMTKITHDGITDKAVTVSLCKNTNTINIIYEGIEVGDRAEDVVEVVLKGRNGIYAHDNSLCGTETITYHPIFEGTGATAVVQRITEGDDMTIVSTQHGYREPFISESLTGLIKEKYTGDDFARYLDIEDTFNLTITVKKNREGKYILVSVQVNDWDVINFDGIEL